jgi:molybdenum cofactor cytidylyltransferase
MSTGIVILAAGESARMGEPKQLLAYRGKTLLRHTIDIAHSVARILLSASPIVVVLGARAGNLREQIDDADVIVAENPDWREGMGTSLRVGLNALLAAHPSIPAVIFLVCDQPLLTADTLGNLITTHERTGSAIVASEYGGALGVPALFARSMFPELLALKGDVGARQIIRAHRDQATGVPFQDGAVDIDTPADYARLGSLTELPTLTPV